jgi:hypothetical protein
MNESSTFDLLIFKHSWISSGRYCGRQSKEYLADDEIARRESERTVNEELSAK